MSRLDRGFDLTRLNGSIGAVTYVTRRGTTVAKQKVPVKSSARRTAAVMNTRTRWMNLVRIYQALNTVGWHPSFMNKTGLQSDFNMFMKANLSTSTVYLPKSVVDARGGVVAPCIISVGSLPSVPVAFDSNRPKSEINMGGMTIGASTTIRTFSQAIINNNPGFLEGDQLTFVVLKQDMSPTAPFTPKIIPDIVEITLDSTDGVTLLGSVIDANWLEVVEGMLAFGGAINGGAAIVHSRGEGANYEVSTSELTVQNTSLNQYSGLTARDTAIASYGGIATTEYLVPDYFPQAEEELP